MHVNGRGYIGSNTAAAQRFQCCRGRPPAGLVEERQSPWEQHLPRGSAQHTGTGTGVDQRAGQAVADAGAPDSIWLRPSGDHERGKCCVGGGAGQRGTGAGPHHLDESGGMFGSASSASGCDFRPCGSVIA